MNARQYEVPRIVDYGTLAELTAAVSITGAEDGGSKDGIHHSAPSAP